MPESYGADERDDPLRRPAYLPSLEDRECIRTVEDRFRQAEESRRYQDELWLECVAYYLDKQWHRYNWQTGNLELPKAPGPWVVRATHNLFKPKIHQAVAALVQDNPQLDVEPMSNQPQDRARARVGKHFLEYLQEELRWSRLWASLAKWSALCGSAFVKAHWDPSKLDRFAVEDKDPMTGMKTLKAQIEAIGQVATQFCSPFEIYPQQGVQSFEDCEWVIHVKVRSLDYIKARYEENGKYVGPEGETSNTGYLERRVADLMSHGQSMPLAQKEDSAVVMEMWEKPCPKYPKGRCATVANGVLLKKRDLPYAHLEERRQLPFVPFYYEQFELSPWGSGLGGPLLSPQKAYNKLLSDLLAILKTTGMPKVLWPTDGGAVPSLWTAQPGQVVPWSAVFGNNAKPEVIQPGAIPPAWLELLDRIKVDMDDIAERHLVSAGSAPTGVTAGVSLQLIGEADNRAFGPRVSLFHDSIAEVGMHSLSLAKEFYDEARLGHVTGDEEDLDEMGVQGEGERRIFAFQSADLPNYADVKAKTQPLMSDAAKRQMVFDLYDRGAFGQPMTPPAQMALLEGLEYPDIDGIVQRNLAFQQFQQQQAQAQAQMQAQQQAQQQEASAEREATSAEQQDQRLAAREGQKMDGQLQMAALKAALQPAPQAPRAPAGRRL